MRYIIFLLLSFNLYAGYPVTNSIMKLCPHLKREQAYESALLIYNYSKQYKINWKIVVAIYRQESICGLKLRNGCESGYAKVNGKWEKIEICKDFGIFHINQINIENDNLNIEKLDKDLEYNLKWVFNYLKTLKKRFKSDPIWYCRFHSNTSHLKYKYCDSLHKHMEKIE